jgi:hypothetical protein
MYVQICILYPLFGINNFLYRMRAIYIDTNKNADIVQYNLKIGLFHIGLRFGFL